MSPPRNDSSNATPTSETCQPRSSWRSLFAFTTRSHLYILVLAVIACVIAGLLKSAQAIILGNIFTELTNYGSGKQDSAASLDHISRWCIALTILGGLAWLLEGLMLSTWMIYGEMQASHIRKLLFQQMLQKELSWYDLQGDGTASLITRMQTSVHCTYYFVDFA